MVILLASCLGCLRRGLTLFHHGGRCIVTSFVLHFSVNVIHGAGLVAPMSTSVKIHIRDEKLADKYHQHYYERTTYQQYIAT